MDPNINYLFTNNGINFSSDPALPQPVSKTLDKVAATGWINSHSTPYQQALRELIENVEFICAEQFQKQLNRSIESFKIQLSERSVKDYTLLVEPKKSNQWVAELAYSRLPKPCYLSRLGIKNAAEFRNELSTQSGLQKNIDVIPKNIVLFDDGSFSGTQITEHVTAIFNELKQNYKIDNSKMPHIYVVIPYMTQYALKRLQGEVDKLHLGDHLHVAEHIQMRTVQNLSLATREKIKELYWPKEAEGNEQHGLFYFAHKVPNDMSFPGPLAKGTVLNGTAQRAPITAKFAIIPSSIQPPYKNEALCNNQTSGLA